MHFTLREVMTFLELFIQYLRANPQVEEVLDTGVLIGITNERAIQDTTQSLSVLQVSGLYWIYHNLGCQWDAKLIADIEERLVKLLR
jgi:hypothetical protein